MKESIISKIKKNDFLKGSLILLISSLTMNALFFLFQIYVGKLGPSESGLFGTLTYLIYLLIIPLTTAIQTIITKFVSTYNVSKEHSKIRYLFLASTKKLLMAGIVISAVFFALSKYILEFLHIESIIPLVLITIIFLLSLVLAINRGILQGLQNFKSLGLNFIMEGAFKLGLGIMFIMLGLGVNGALMAIIVSYLIPWLISFISFRELFSISSEKFSTKDLYEYSYPVFITMFLLTAFYSIDVLLVRHFLNQIDTGYYWAASLLGKIVFFASSSIALVMFPKVNELNLKNANTKKLLRKSIGLVMLIAVPITLVYYLIPEFILRIIGFYSQYSSITNFLGLFGVIMTIYSLVYVLCFYNLSLRKTGFIYLLGFFVILEAVLISLYHSSIIEILSILLALITFLLISIIIVTLRKNGTLNNNTSV